MSARDASRAAEMALSLIRSGACALPGSSSAMSDLGSVRLRAMPLSFGRRISGARLRDGRAPRRGRPPGRVAVVPERHAGAQRGAAPLPACRHSSRSRGRLRLVVFALRAAAVLLRLVEELDLALQQLVLEVLALQVELDRALECGLTRVALVEAALDDDPRGRQGDLPLPAEAGLRLLGDLAVLRQQPLPHELRFGRFQGRV